MSTAKDRFTNGQETPLEFSTQHLQLLRRRLLAWYKLHARNLPWRMTRDPYHVWVSEVMLQQTQVATVRDYFTRFVAALPDVHRLAAADEQHVLRLWEGLGYYRRARQLHAAAKQVVARYDGRFPREVAELQTLPGIGRYTAGAIASIAFDERAAILEANTIRLLSRLIGYHGDPHRAAGQRTLWHVAESILPQRNVAHFNQALMELGSLICTPSEPRCHECPLSVVCAARVTGRQQEIPRPKPRPATTEIREAAVVIRRNGRVLMRQCGASERWAGLWDFPRVAAESTEPIDGRRELMAKVRAQTGISCRPAAMLATIKHGVTRYRITLDCYEAAFVSGRVQSTNGAPVRWMTLAALAELPLSTTGRKIAQLLLHVD